MDLAAFILVDHLNGNELNQVTSLSETPEDFRLDFKITGGDLKAGPGIEMHEAIAILSVRQPTAGQPGKSPAHPAIHLASEPGHSERGGHAIAHDESGAGLVGASQESWEIAGRVLAITVHRQGPGKSLRASDRPAVNQGRPFALGLCVAQDFGAGGACLAGRIVRGSVIDDQDAG
jgi:hypothetical protein